MALDESLLNRAKESGARWVEAQRQAGLAKAEYQHAVRRLHFAGASLREIAEGLEISHQRVHQIIEATGGAVGWKRRKKASSDCSCTFCGLPQPEVAKLIAGPGVFVCDSCIEFAHRVVEEKTPIETPDTRFDPVTATSQLRCSFCAKAADTVESLVAGPGVRICNRCLQLCDEIIAEESN